MLSSELSVVVRLQVSLPQCYSKFFLGICDAELVLSARVSIFVLKILKYLDGIVLFGKSLWHGGCFAGKNEL